MGIYYHKRNIFKIWIDQLDGLIIKRNNLIINTVKPSRNHLILPLMPINWKSNKLIKDFIKAVLEINFNHLFRKILIFIIIIDKSLLNEQNH